MCTPKFRLLWATRRAELSRYLLSTSKCLRSAGPSSAIAALAAGETAAPAGAMLTGSEYRPSKSVSASCDEPTRVQLLVEPGTTQHGLQLLCTPCEDPQCYMLRASLL